MSAFKILIDRLKGGHTQKIEERLPPTFLGPDEPELKFKNEVVIKGETYLSEAHLIIHLKAATKVLMPCAVCNQMTEIHLNADSIYHAEPIEEIRGAIFDYSDTLREALLIELPKTAECNGGKCPDRILMAPFIRPKDRTHFPFADMDKNLKKEN